MIRHPKNPGKGSFSFQRQSRDQGNMGHIAGRARLWLNRACWTGNTLFLWTLRRPTVGPASSIFSNWQNDSLCEMALATEAEWRQTSELITFPRLGSRAPEHNIVDFSPHRFRKQHHQSFKKQHIFWSWKKHVF
jgi:anti-sigma factor RsiW